MTERRRYVVAGGGVTGLTAAHQLRLKDPEAEVVLFEAAPRLGGNIVTESRDGFVLDGGPDSFLRTKPEAVALCKELGLEQDFITTRPEARTLYMAQQGKLVQMPGGMVLAVPTRLGPMLKTPLLSFGGKLRTLGDLFVEGARGEEDESIESFLERHFGREAAERIGAPLLGGIYAGDIGELSIRATFPQLVELEQRHGSLIRGVFSSRGGGGRRPSAREVWRWLRRESEQQQHSPFLSLRRGMGSLIEALAARLPEQQRRLDSPVERIVPLARGYEVIARGERLRADGVVIASPAHAAQKMFGPSKLRDELAQIRYLSTATVFFAFETARLPRPLDGVGFVVPHGEGKILASTWISSKWNERAPRDHVLVRAFLGGARSELAPERHTDPELVSVAHGELSRLMGPLPEPVFTRVFRYPRSNPQPVVGHRQRLARIEAELASLPGIALAGAAYDGVGIPDCVRQGRAAALRVARA